MLGLFRSDIVRLRRLDGFTQIWLLDPSPADRQQGSKDP